VSALTAAAVAALVILVVGLWWLAARVRRRRRLSTEFAGEYDRTVAEQGSRRQAEDELLRRRERHDRLRLRPLSAQDKAGFLRSWQDLQAQFVDRPYGTVMHAEELTRHLMAKRGYPVQSFEQEAADLSVEHPQAVQDLRAAHELISGATAQPSTEELRTAMVQYRRLCTELLEPDEDSGAEQAESTVAAPRPGHRRARRRRTPCPHRLPR
jgi:hypothetical protein